jgi:hypothetical protein
MGMFKGPVDPKLKKMVPCESFIDGDMWLSYCGTNDGASTDLRFDESMLG